MLRSEDIRVQDLLEQDVGVQSTLVQDLCLWNVHLQDVLVCAGFSRERYPS